MPAYAIFLLFTLNSNSFSLFSPICIAIFIIMDLAHKKKACEKIYFPTVEWCVTVQMINWVKTHFLKITFYFQRTEKFLSQNVKTTFFKWTVRKPAVTTLALDGHPVQCTKRNTISVITLPHILALSRCILKPISLQRTLMHQFMINSKEWPNGARKLKQSL